MFRFEAIIPSLWFGLEGTEFQPWNFYSCLFYALLPDCLLDRHWVSGIYWWSIPDFLSLMSGTGEGESIEFLKHWFFDNSDWTSLLEQITAWLENGFGNNKKETIRSAKNLILSPIFESTQSKSIHKKGPNYWSNIQFVVSCCWQNETFQFMWCKWS